MNVGELKEQLIGVPDDALIVRPGRDHDYKNVQIELTTAIRYNREMISEDPGRDDPLGKRVPILLLV